MQIGFHASHEQYPPGHLLSLIKRAEAAGFAAGMCSDHVTPFSERQGESGFAWSWLGAALASTQMTLGTVNAPGQRYHPVMVAHAIATLAEMFPGRFWVALGSGQLINEHVTGGAWPRKDERNERLRQSVEVIRRLLAGETVSFDGLVTVDEARIYSLPRIVPRIFAAALTAETASWAASWSDGLITVYAPYGGLAEVVRAYRDSGGAGKPILLQAQHQYDETEDAALSAAHDQWRQSVLSSGVTAELRTARQIDEASELARPEDVAKRIRISADLGQHVRWIEEYRALGIDAVYLHNVGRNQERFIDDFGKQVLPCFA